MPVTPDRVSRLRSFGLSEYASRTYLALLDLGVAEARDISGISKVPASKIYRILDQLHEKGLVDILPEFPRKYAPIPFGEYLDKIHEEHRAAAAQIADEREVLASMFAVVGDVESSDRGGFTVVRGRRNALEKVQEIVGIARRSLIVHATPGIAGRPEALADALRAAAQRGVRVRLLLPSDAPAEALAPREGETRRMPDDAADIGGLVVVADGEHAIVVHFVPDDGHPLDGNDVGVASDQPGVVGILGALLEAPWTHADRVGTEPRGVQIVADRPERLA